MPWLMMILLSSLLSFAGIPVLGMSDTNQVITGEISEKDYADTLKVLKDTMDQKVVVGISAIETSSHWQLSKFSLGLGLTGEVGIGPYKYSSALKQRFVYSR